MFGNRHYIPILKWKRGEQRALAQIEASLTRFMTPVIEVVPSKRDLDTGEPKNPIDVVVADATESIVKSWGTDRPFFLEWNLIFDEYTEPGLMPGRMLVESVAAAGLQAIPVTGLQRPVPDQELAVKYANKGLCIRITPDDFSNSLSARISWFISNFDLTPNTIDVIVDLGDIETTKASMALMQAKMLLDAIPRIGEYRTLSLAASAYPRTRGSLVSGESVSRTEWMVYRALAERRAVVSRLPSFADYGVQHPEFLDFDPRFMTPSAAIRYTLPDEWLFVIGRNVRRHGLEQFRVLSQQLVVRDAFAGPQHCEGCKAILAIANGDRSPGNLETWVVICTTHHITEVANSLANLT